MAIEMTEHDLANLRKFCVEAALHGGVASDFTVKMAAKFEAYILGQDPPEESAEEPDPEQLNTEQQNDA